MSDLQISAMSFFCEDIREETGGQFTLVGILPDNIEVSSVPGSIAKLGIFTRINLPTDQISPRLAVKILAHDGSVLATNDIEPALVTKTVSEAAAKEAPFTGIVSRVIGANLPILSAGRISVIVDVDGKEVQSGFLNIIQSS